MELQKFVREFANLFDDVDTSEITENTKFQELEEWSSLIVLSIIAFVKIDFSKVVTGKEIRSCETVKELFDLIQVKGNV